MKPIRVVLADDHALVRAGFRALLTSLSDIAVVAEAADGDEALRVIEAEQPDVVLLDIGMPGVSGLSVIEHVTQQFPQVRVIILSMYADQAHVLQALRAGAAGYLLKGAHPSELEFAINAAVRGETYLSPAVSKHLVGEMLRGRGEGGALDTLTPRQREVLQLIAAGHTTKAIAQRLGISVQTVAMHRTQLMERLGIHDVAGLVRYALRMGLVPPEA
jgi:DNA-binding NarL/FixJ family response regulator